MKKDLIRRKKYERFKNRILLACGQYENNQNNVRYIKCVQKYPIEPISLKMALNPAMEQDTIESHPKT